MTKSIHVSVKIEPDTEIGEFCVIEEGVQIGRNCRISHHVVIHAGTVIGDEVRIDAFSVIGKRPMRAKRSIFKDQELEPARIGSHVMIGAQAVIYRGCTLDEHVLIADGAAVREQVTIGAYTIVGRNATVENLTTIGRKCKLETNCYITAYSTIEDFCFIAPGVHTTNDNYMGRTQERFKHFKGVTVRRGGRIGGHSVILPGKEIGADAMVAAGSVVTRDVPPRTVVVGSPAHPLRAVPDEQLLENQGWEE
ncbi:MAG TPA: acyltransferase [bacterium]|nr:acyltransferase [bacterium]HPG46703.1 acyltransferase [bacterium]HPM98765.1 acyltransferase [bacterium]